MNTAQIMAVAGALVFAVWFRHGCRIVIGRIQKAHAKKQWTVTTFPAAPWYKEEGK